ncbi:hypothetical protein SAMN05216489_00119 [Streptomyces sp. 3213]|uniref:nuclear transport factor 2 family protein n=1 Tax=Streptomyces sp. 3213.3 TaxID=1855348 RepID=UPI000899BC4B|nr:nuclear transport factor 2 family protein [Streptomyces sp. 3213.3]SEC19232.1 hypothetical protein SAMN05216489_00119 [Streptomyces sp. 3213] [Streptomyces sp. 3213.3]
MAKHPNVEVFENFHDCITRGDMGKLPELIAPDVVWHVPGDNLISGAYISRDDLFGCFNKIFELSDGSYQAQLLGILADDSYTVALLHAKARHGDKVLDQDYAFIMRIHGGQITELQEAWTEGTAWNEFWS